MADEDLRGGPVIAIAPQTLRWAVDQMVGTLGPEMLGKLKVNAGEHLAALLATAFLFIPPVAIDAEGGADLVFDLPHESATRTKKAPFLAGDKASAAFEIKSMPGPFREWNNSIDRDRARGIEAEGRGMETQVRSVNDVLREATPVLERAQRQLQRKTGDGSSRHIFLVVHLFDYFVAEATRTILGPLLDSLPDLEDVDTVWVLWPMEHLTIWSSRKRIWTDLLFNVGRDPGAAASSGSAELSVLQDAEAHYLARVGHTGGSPYLFRVSSGDETGEEG